jgi:hypothetical protein
MNIADQLEKLQQLRKSGVINDKELDQAKALILNGPPPARASGVEHSGGFPAAPGRPPITLAELRTGKWIPQGAEVLSMYFRFKANGTITCGGGSGFFGGGLFGGLFGGADGAYTYEGNQLTMFLDGLPVVSGRLSWQEPGKLARLDGCLSQEFWKHVS